MPYAVCRMKYAVREYASSLMDILGPLPETAAGNRSVWVVGGYFSKQIEAYPIPNERAETCARKITEEWIARQGCPETLHSDQGHNFESKVMLEVCNLLGIEKTRITPLNPKSDGMIERFNRTMIDVIQALLDPRKNQRDWDEVLPYAMMAYRSSVQESTRETPYVMTYGEETMLPVDLFGVPEDQEQDDELLTDYAKELRHRLRDAHSRARIVLQGASRRQKRNYDKKAVAKSYLVESFVWLSQKSFIPIDSSRTREETFTVGFWSKQTTSYCRDGSLVLLLRIVYFGAFEYSVFWWIVENRLFKHYQKHS